MGNHSRFSSRRWLSLRGLNTIAHRETTSAGATDSSPRLILPFNSKTPYIIPRPVPSTIYNPSESVISELRQEALLEAVEDFDFFGKLALFSSSTETLFGVLNSDTMWGIVECKRCDHVSIFLVPLPLSCPHLLLF